MMNWADPSGRGRTGRRNSIALLPLVALALVPEQAFGQTAQPQTGGVLEEIVVTAQKRTERLQDVPISANVVGGTTLQSRALESLQDLSGALPTMRVVTTAPSDKVFIRGIGSGNNASFEQSVGTFIDDVYYGRSKTSQSSFFDIERIEVLKGPQSIYFGNNSIAGAINITTRKPGREADGFVRALYQPTDGGYAVEAGATLPIGDAFRIRAAGLVNGGSGYMRDTGAGGKVGDEDNRAGRLTAIWEPSDRLSFTLKGEVAKEKQEGGIIYELFNCPPPPEFAAGPQGFCAAALSIGQTDNELDFRRSTNAGQYIKLLRHEVSGTVSYSIGETVLTSVTAYTDYDYDLFFDYDTTPLRLGNAKTPERYEQFSQELRITSPQDRPLEYIAGLYYQHGDLAQATNFDYSFLTPFLPAPLLPLVPFGQSDSFVEESRNYSVFGALTANLTPELKITAGLRGTRVEKEFVQDLFFGRADFPTNDIIRAAPALEPLANGFAAALGLGQAGVRPRSRADSHWSPSAQIQYDLTPDVMVYGSYANGFKAGGFNGFDTTGGNLEFGPEKVDAFEVGLKSQLFGRSMTFNLAAFHSKYSDLQQTVVQLTSAAIINIVKNVASAVSRGIEGELHWAVDEHWQLGLNATLLDATYRNFPNASPRPIEVEAGITSVDLSGQHTPYSPTFSGSASVQYKAPISSDFEFRAFADLFYSGKYTVSENLDRYLQQDPYAKLDASLTIANLTQGWEFSVVGKNLTNASILTWGSEAPNAAGSYNASRERPRSVAFQVRATF